ncbi:MAG: pyroglutamyl-peptidase I [Acidobacteriota bacterium]
MKKVLLTAFEAFDGETINPSMEALLAIKKISFDGVTIDVLELPVDRFVALAMVLERLRETRPDVVIMLGEAGRRYRVTPERVAINVDDFRIPDNVGNQPKGEAIVEGAPVAYFSTLPIYEIVDGLKAVNIPAAISNSAGTYLCNRIFYAVMHHLAENQLTTRAGFIHLPYIHEQVIDKKYDFPSLSRETVIAAVRIAIEASIARE